VNLSDAYDFYNIGPTLGEASGFMKPGLEIGGMV